MDFDITGPTADCRFPWQRDVAVQCTSAPFAADSVSLRRPRAAAGNVECNNNAHKLTHSWSTQMAREMGKLGRPASHFVNGRSPSEGALREQQQQQSPGSPPIHHSSKERLRGGSPPSVAYCSGESFSSAGDESVVGGNGKEGGGGGDDDNDDDKHLRQQYTRSSGLWRRPAVISSYNFPPASSGLERVSDKKDNEAVEVFTLLPDDERPRGEHRTNSMSALSRASAYNSAQSLSVSRDAEIKAKSKSLHSVLRIGGSRKKKPEALKSFLQNSYRRKEFGSEQLASYKKASLADILVTKDGENDDPLSEAEMKKMEAMWEVFTNECTFLFDHLLVLRHCFLDPLKEAQVEGHLLEVDLPKLFGNLEDLCQISYAFCHDFIQSLRSSPSGFCSMSDLVDCLEKMVHNSHKGEAYEEYVLKYKAAVSYLSVLRESVADFQFYENFCSQDQRCNRLSLKDLLVAPMHHWTRLPVILKNVCKQTKQASERASLSAALHKVETSLRVIDDKMEELKPLERLQDLQQQLVWPTVTDLDPKAYVPEFLRDIIHDEPREVELADQRRELIHEGPLQLLVGEKEKLADVYVFLLSDMVLITKVKKEAKRKDLQKKLSVTDRTGGEMVYYVQKQPMPVEYINVYDIKTKESPATSVKSVFAITQSNCFQQTIAVATFQAPSEEAKMRWLESLSHAREWQQSSGSGGGGGSTRHDSFSRQFTEEEREKLRRCTRLLTVDDSAASRVRSRSTGSSSTDGGGAAVGHGSGSANSSMRASTNWLTIVASSSAIVKATAECGQQSSSPVTASIAAVRSVASDGRLNGGDSSEPESPPLLPGSDECVSHQQSVDSGDAVFF